MINDAESVDIERRSNVDYYKDLLKSYILGSDTLPQIPETEMERYIAVFSLYLRHSNEAYKYNLPYLGNQHKSFVAFLTSAPGKAEKLLNIIKSINKSEAVRKLIDNNAKFKEELSVSLNDFLSADLSENIDFHRSFSLSGATRRKEEDLITIEYKQQVRVVKLSNSKKSDLEKITSAVEKILSNSLKGGG